IVKLLDATTASGAWLLKSRLAIGDRRDAERGRWHPKRPTASGDAISSRLSQGCSAAGAPWGQAILLACSRKYLARQIFELQTFAHRVMLAQLSQRPLPLIGGTLGHLVKQPLFRRALFEPLHSRFRDLQRLGSLAH